MHLTHRNLSARALFCHNSLAKVNTQLSLSNVLFIFTATNESITTSTSRVEASQPPQPVQGFAQGFSIIKREDVTSGSVLGGGGFGTVYLASHKHWGDVAVKQFKSL